MTVTESPFSPIISIIEPYTILLVLALTVVIRFYKSFLQSQIHTMLTTTSKQRETFADLREQLTALRAEALQYKGSTSHFAQYSLITRKVKALEAEYEATPADLRNPNSASVHWLASLPTTLILVVAFFVLPSTLFELPANDESCFGSINQLIQWPFTSNFEKPVFEQVDALEVAGGVVLNCAQLRFILSPSYFGVIIVYYLFNSMIDTFISISKSFKSSKRMKFL